MTRSRGVIGEWQRQPLKETSPPKLFASVVGVSTYWHRQPEPALFRQDAVDFGHALERAARGMLGRERTHVAVLASETAQEPTKANIRHALERVA